MVATFISLLEPTASLLARVDAPLIDAGVPLPQHLIDDRKQIRPYDLKPLCPVCSSPTPLAIDETGTYIYTDHTARNDGPKLCCESSQPVAYGDLANARRAYPSTSVHAGESTYETDPRSKSAGEGLTYTDDERDFRHSGWAPVRRRVHDALHAADVRNTRKIAFDHCGSNAWVMIHDTADDRYRIASSHCHDRFCTPCAHDRSHTIRCNLRSILQERRDALNAGNNITHRFLTLTVRTRPNEPLAETLDSLAGWFKSLRATRLWRGCVDGGAAILELKYNEQPGRWHPHLHIIIEGRFMPHDAIKRVWHAITKTSYVCHIEKLGSDEDTIRYVTKYTSKPLDGSFSHDQDLLVEAIRALAGRKLVATFGTWYRYRLLKREASSGWTTCITLNSLIARADAGDRECQRIWNIITDRTPRVRTPDDSPQQDRPP